MTRRPPTSTLFPYPTLFRSAASTPATISAVYRGVTRPATLTVNPQPVLLSSLGVNPTTVTGGSNSTGTATLDGPAPAGGAQVTLSSDNTAATVPASGRGHVRTPNTSL